VIAERPYQKWPRQLRQFVLLAFYVYCVVMVVGAISGIVWLAVFGLDNPPQPPDPQNDFAHLTGWTLPPTARIISATNTIGGFRNDGKYLLIVRVSPEQIQRWLSTAAPEDWQTGSVPDEVRRYWHSPPQYDGIVYRIKRVMDDDTDWHRGSIVIINPDSGTVWVYAWKV
jgi:hypothetical protein